MRQYKRHMMSGVMILTACAVIQPAMISHALTLSGSAQGYRNRVIEVCGIADAERLSEALNRAEFAKMLVLASTEKDASGVSRVAAAGDVPAEHEYASYIRIALRNGWMRTRLGGLFEPSSPVNLNEAAKAVLSLLGYTDEDFAGNVTEGRLSMCRSLALLEGISAQNGTDVLTRQDGINLIYNLLRTNEKGGSNIYGAFMGLSLASDGEINPNELMELNMEGPVLVKSVAALESALPFELEEASIYYNGINAGSYTFGIRYYESQINQNGWIILYYNEETKTVWGYGNDTGDNTYHCVKGKVDAIYYEADNIVSPSSVVLSGTEYTLNSADVKFMFSINGEIEVGDEVILICKDNTSYGSDGEALTDYYAVGVVLYNSKDEETKGTAYPENVLYYQADKGQEEQ